jgi:hypothetical protein
MPHILIARRLIMLPRGNPVTSICGFHRKRCELSSAVNFSSILRRELEDVLKMLIGNNKNMPFYCLATTCSL